MTTILDYRLLDLDNLNFNSPKKIKGNYIGKILYNNNDINIKLPFIKCLSPIIINQDRCYIELDLDVEDKDIYSFFSDNDSININTAYKNSKLWFDEQFPLDTIDDYYGPFIKLHTKYKRPYIRIKINKDDILKFKNDDFKLGNLISPIIHYDGLIFFKQRFTCSWTLINYELVKNYEFNTDLFDLEDNLKNKQENLLEDKLETKLETKLEDRLETKLEDKLEDKLGDKLGNRLENKLEDKLEDKLGDKLEDKLKDKLEDKLEIKLENKAKDIDKNKSKNKKKDNHIKKKKIIKYANKSRIWNIK